jgi:hypothetical protein
VLVGASIVLGRKDNWRDFAGWLRSAGAAIVLFACAGGRRLARLGLQWISANACAVAPAASPQTCTSHTRPHAGFALHVLLSLLPLPSSRPARLRLRSRALWRRSASA